MTECLFFILGSSYLFKEKISHISFNNSRENQKGSYVWRGRGGGAQIVALFLIVAFKGKIFRIKGLKF